MILYQLHCDQNHRFEGWFKNSEAFDAQAERRLVACPICNSITVGKAPMAPRIAKGGRPKNEPKEEISDDQHTHGEEVLSLTNNPHLLLRALVELRKNLEASSENVGDRFCEEARRIHYGESQKRPIHGEATLDELRDLDEEGIDAMPLPWITRYDA